MFPFGGYIIYEVYAGFFLAGKKSTKALHFLFCSLNRKVGEIPANTISDGKRTGERRTFIRLSWSVCCPLNPLSLDKQTCQKLIDLYYTVLAARLRTWRKQTRESIFFQ